MDRQLNEQLAQVIFRVGRCMRQHMMSEEKAHELTMAQLETLIFVKEQTHPKMQDVAEKFHISMPSATSLVNKLVLLKLVKRQSNQKDRRIVTLEITKKGVTLLQEGWKKKQEKINHLLNFIPKQDKPELLRILSQLVANIDYEK